MFSCIATGFLFDRKSIINIFCHYKSFSAAGLIFTGAITQTRLHPCVYNRPINLFLSGKNIREFLTEEECCHDTPLVIHQETSVFGMTRVQQFSLDTPTVCLGKDIICNIFYENQFLFSEL